VVVVKLKPLSEILKNLRGFKKIAIFGCELGSARCKNGGLKEALQLKSSLEKEGFEVINVKSPGGTCILEKVSRSFLEIEKSCEVVISLACGAGTQVIAENTNLPVITGVSTLFIGAEKEGKYFDEYCIACGDCIISDTGGICPVARCPKSLVNGPCGGAINGKCEVNSSIPCIWYKIAERLEGLQKLEVLRERAPFKDYRLAVYPRKLEVEETT